MKKTLRQLWPVYVLLAMVLMGAAINVTDTTVYQALFRPWTRATTQLPAATAYLGYVAYNTTNGDLTVSDGTNWRTASPILASAAWDFPSLSNGVLGTPCSETAAVTATGAALGYGCQASSNLGMDGGADLLSTAQLSCRVSATNAVVFKLCVQLTDAGTYDLTDAGFFARVSN